MYCSVCGSQGDEESKFCTRCGKPLGPRFQARTDASVKPQDLQFAMPAMSPAAAAQAVAPAENKVYAVGKTPWIAAFASFFLPGVGQIYNGDNKKGALMLPLALVLVVVTGGLANLLLSIWSSVDAYKVAKGKWAFW